ncbi:MAG TPA: hypothetical protein VL988_09475 [Solirubrobacteraceae bacterium]|nr:hypothetical protein [Solirubrobacteraceae bacterium]
MKLGFMCPPINNAYYRAIIPMRALESRGHTVVWPTRLGEDTPTRDLLTCDLVHCYRRGDRTEDLKQLGDRGVAITFDNDDDFALAEVSDGGSGLAGNRYNRKIARRLLQAAGQCDLVTTPSEVLADSYRRSGIEHAVVIPNYLDRGMFGFGSTSRHVGVVVGWVAGREHQLDLERVPILNALRQLLDAHEDLRVLTVGLRLPLRSDRYEHVERVEYPDLLKAIGRIDIGVAPLADSAFNRSRSDVKLKEYGAGGACWLASPVGPYRDLGEKQGGSLVADGEWFEAIDRLLRSDRTRRRLAKRALKWARQQTVDKHAQLWESAFLAAMSRAQEQ